MLRKLALVLILIIAASAIGGGIRWQTNRNSTAPPEQAASGQDTQASSSPEIVSAAASGRTTPKSPLLLVAQTQEIASQQENTRLEMYDVESRTLYREVKLYEDVWKMSEEGSSIRDRMVFHSELNSWNSRTDQYSRGQDFQLEVASKIGENMLATPKITSPDGLYTIFKLYKDTCAIQAEMGCGSEPNDEIEYYYIYSRTDRTVKPLTLINDFPKLEYLRRAIWSPDSKILYLIPDTGQVFYEVNWNAFSYTKAHAVRHDRAYLYSDPSIGNVFAISHDGSRIALDMQWRGRLGDYSLWSAYNQTSSAYDFYSQSDLYVYDLKTGKTSKTIAHGYEVRDLVWSPNDAKIIAVIDYREPEDTETVEVFDAIDLRRVWVGETYVSNRLSEKNFSPDSRYIAYPTNISDGIVVFNLASNKKDTFKPNGLPVTFLGWIAATNL